MFSPFVPAVSFFVYLMANRRNGTLYTGVTDDLVRRVWQHRTGAVPGFTSKYGVKILVWYEQHETRESALVRERQIEKWYRSWKLQLIERTNPAWIDYGIIYPCDLTGSPLARGRTEDVDALAVRSPGRAPYRQNETPAVGVPTAG